MLHGTPSVADGRCMLRLGMTNPPFILEHLAQVAEVLQDPRVFSYLHVPVRGGGYSGAGLLQLAADGASKGPVPAPMHACTAAAPPGHALLAASLPLTDPCPHGVPTPHPHLLFAPTCL